MFDLKRLVEITNNFNCFLTINLNAFECFIFCNDLPHFFFNFWKIFFSDRFFCTHVIVKPIAHCWAESQFHTLEQSHDGSCHNMSSRMPHDRQRARITWQQEFDSRLSFFWQETVESNDFSIKDGGDWRFLSLCLFCHKGRDNIRKTSTRGK